MSVYRTKLTKESKQFNIVFRKNYKFMKRGNKMPANIVVGSQWGDEGKGNPSK